MRPALPPRAGGYDARPDISVPVLLVRGDQDLYFPKEVDEETARLIPDCTLRMYEGIGHVRAVHDYGTMLPASVQPGSRESPAELRVPLKADGPTRRGSPWLVDQADAGYEGLA